MIEPSVCLHRRSCIDGMTCSLASACAALYCNCRVMRVCQRWSVRRCRRRCSEAHRRLSY